MSLRRALIASAAGCFIHGALAACASFSAAPATPDQDSGAGVPDASVSGEGGAAGDASIPTDGSCEAQAGTKQPVSLYVFGGNVTDDDGNVTGEAKTIYRAPILCDGSLGSWAQSGPLPQQPHGMQYGAAGVSGDHLIVTGGYSNQSPNYTATVYAYEHGADGGLGDYTPTVLAIVPRWHHTLVTAGDALVLLGGNDSGGSAISEVETLRFGDGGVVAIKQPRMDHARSGSAAAFANGRIVIVGPRDDPSVADVADGGSVSNWRTLGAGGRQDLDLVAATDGTKMYFVGGVSAPTSVTLATVGPGGAVSLAPGRSLEPPGIAQSASATWRGRMYIVSGRLRKRVVSTGFATSGVTDLRPEEAFPEARLGHVAVVF